MDDSKDETDDATPDATEPRKPSAPLRAVPNEYARTPARTQAGEPGRETVRLKITEQERVLFPVLVAFGLAQVKVPKGTKLAPEQIESVRAEMKMRALSFLTGIPVQVLTPEIVALETVDAAPENPKDRLVRLKPTVVREAPSRLVDPHGRRLTS